MQATLHASTSQAELLRRVALKAKRYSNTDAHEPLPADFHWRMCSDDEARR